VKLLWTRRALADLARIAEHIAADNPAAAADFVAQVRSRVLHLQRFPLLGRIGALQDTRELVVHKNYLITYRARADEVQLLQVWHVAQRR
jgi:addiction module RelE/StbE family toxin